MKKVYSVSAGAYSEYNVKCLFETREDAERACKEIRQVGTYEYEDPFVEEFVYYANGEQPTRIKTWSAAASEPTWEPKLYFDGKEKWDYEVPKVVEEGIDPECVIVTDDHTACYDIRLIADSSERARKAISEYARRRLSGDPVAELLT